MILIFVVFFGKLLISSSQAGERCSIKTKDNKFILIDDGGEISSRCTNNFLPANISITVQCKSGSASLLECKFDVSKQCYVPDIANGTLVFNAGQTAKNETAVGSLVTAKCDENYVLYGPENTKCEKEKYEFFPYCKKKSSKALLMCMCENRRIFDPTGPTVIVDIDMGDETSCYFENSVQNETHMFTLKVFEPILCIVNIEMYQIEKSYTVKTNSHLGISFNILLIIADSECQNCSLYTVNPLLEIEKIEMNFCHTGIYCMASTATGHVFIFDGANLTKSERYNYDDRSFTIISSPTIPFHGTNCAAAEHEGSILVCNEDSDCLFYYPQNDNWANEKKHFFRNRYDPGLASVNGKLYVFNGWNYDEDGESFSEYAIEVYNEADQEFEIFYTVNDAMYWNDMAFGMF